MIPADWRERVVVETESMPWQAFDATGVACKPLEHGVGASMSALLTCAPGDELGPPGAGLGEEILVLEGVLADARGEYVAGTYLRNPPGTQLVLRTDHGCVLFVKRYSFEPADSAEVRLDTASMTWLPGLVTGLSVMPLHQHQYEHVALVRWQPETFFQPHSHFGGEEILVLSGVFADEHGSYAAGTWIRSPHLSRHQPFSRPGCTIYVKTGHLMVAE